MGRQSRLIFQNKLSTTEYCNTAVADGGNIIKRQWVPQCNVTKSEISSVKWTMPNLFLISKRALIVLITNCFVFFSKYQYFSCSSEVILLYGILPLSNVSSRNLKQFAKQLPLVRVPKWQFLHQCDHTWWNLLDGVSFEKKCLKPHLVMWCRPEIVFIWQWSVFEMTWQGIHQPLSIFP